MTTNASIRSSIATVPDVDDLVFDLRHGNHGSSERRALGDLLQDVLDSSSATGHQRLADAIASIDELMTAAQNLRAQLHDDPSPFVAVPKTSGFSATDLAQIWSNRQHHPDRCPCCGVENYTNDTDTTYQGNTVDAATGCNDCGVRWTDTYRFDNVTVIDPSAP